jgi:predicted TIM-barrel fold metal-dependent hydrolase
MLIVDSQVHTWAADTPERPWSGGGEPHRTVPLTNQDLLREMDVAGVDRAVLVPPGWEGSRNDLALAAARAHPDRFAVMGRIAHDRLSRSQGALVGWRKQPGMLGLRLAFNTPKAAAIFGSGKLDWLWNEAEAQGVPLMILVWHADVHFVDAIAAEHPRLRIVLDHLGLQSSQRDAEAFRDFDQLLAIAKRPNVAAKASALPSYARDPYPFRSLHPYIRRAYDAFGPRRLFWGTDLSRSPIPYRQQVTMFTEELPWLTTDDKEWIMGRGICEWLGWPVQHRSSA